MMNGSGDTVTKKRLGVKGRRLNSRNITFPGESLPKVLLPGALLIFQMKKEEERKNESEDITQVYFSPLGRRRRPGR